MTSDNVAPVARPGANTDPQRISVSTGGDRRRRPSGGRPGKTPGGAQPPPDETSADAPTGTNLAPQTDDDSECGRNVDVCA